MMHHKRKKNKQLKQTR